MTKSSRRSTAPWWAELNENLNFEALGLLLFLIGGGLLLTLLRGGAGSLYGVPWLVQMTGWTAPLMVLGLMVVGALLMLRDQLFRLGGHWGIEAIIGGELLLLALQAGDFLWHNETVTWSPRMDGVDGGVVGWALGSLLMAGLGRWPAFAIVLAGGLIGTWLLIRYTPLIYTLPPLRHALTQLPALRSLPIDWQHWQARAAAIGQRFAAPVLAPTGGKDSAKANFVTARQVAALDTDDDDADDVDDEPLPLPPRRSPPPPVQSLRRDRAVVAERPAAPPAPLPVAPVAAKKVAKPKSAPPPAMPLPSGPLPTLDLLSADPGIYVEVGAQQMQELIENTLEDFNVPVKVVHVESGPTVTQFGVAPLYLERAGQRRKVRVNRIVSLADDLALALAVPSVRIEAPLPGRPYVGIEVPNTEKAIVSLRGVMETKAYQQDGGRLPLPLGRNTAGAGVVMDLTRAPHMLIAGSTGSGKSVCINTIITGLLMRYGPESLRFIMVDPKMVELPGYNPIPHLLGKVITEVDQVMGALTWLLLQMDDRYQAFKAVGVRNLETYNALATKKPKKGETPITPYPYIVLVIDELADLMMTAADDIERQICRLAQMARATGIHLIIATQRPSTDVVTGLIKANFPTRIAFAVTSQIDSRVILDSVGAERLLGRGDMLLMRPDMAKLQRVQGCLVTDEEINHIVAFWKAQARADARPTVAPWTGLLDQLDDEDGLIQDAIDVLRDLESCSTSFLQRKLKIGYPKAARLMEDLEKKGVVGPDAGGGQGRPILLKKKEEDDSADELDDDEFGE